MKWLIVLFLLFVVWAFIAVRYRRQIQTGIYVFKMFRKMRQMNKTPEREIAAPVNEKDVRLIRCAKCGTWTPQKNALNLRNSQTFYCSASCMEQAVNV